MASLVWTLTEQFQQLALPPPVSCCVFHEREDAIPLARIFRRAIEATRGSSGIWHGIWLEVSGLPVWIERLRAHGNLLGLQGNLHTIGTLAGPQARVVTIEGIGHAEVEFRSGPGFMRAAQLPLLDDYPLPLPLEAVKLAILFGLLAAEYPSGFRPCFRGSSLTPFQEFTLLEWAIAG